MSRRPQKCRRALETGSRRPLQRTMGDGRRWSKKGLGIRAIGAGNLSGGHAFLHGTGASSTGSFGGLVWILAGCGLGLTAVVGQSQLHTAVVLGHCGVQTGGREGRTVHVSVPGISHSGA